MAAAIGLLGASSAFADPAPNNLFDNYTGTGPCAPHTNACTDSGTMDNLYIEPMKQKNETDREKQLRESFQLPEETQPDIHIALRILRNHGQNCTMEGGAFWSGNHLNFQDRPPYGAKICKLQLTFNNDQLAIKDPGNICGWKFCSIDKPMKLAGMRFKKGPDQLLAADKKSTTPPPASIFGKYNGTGKCATDERKTVICNEKKHTDYVVITASKTADAHVVIGSSDNAGDTGDFHLLDADAMWLGNHLAFIKELPDQPGSPQLLEFWFKDNTVVIRDVGSHYSGALIQGAYFKKVSPQPSHSKQR